MTIFLSFSIFKVLSEKISQSNQDTAVTKFQNYIPYIKYKNKCYKKIQLLTSMFTTVAILTIKTTFKFKICHQIG